MSSVVKRLDRCGRLDGDDRTLTEAIQQARLRDPEDVATKADLAALESRIGAKLESLRSRINVKFSEVDTL